MSKATSPGITDCAFGANPNVASGSTKRRISQADAIRSAPGLGSVTQRQAW
jgi:hypothetical protein